MQVKCENCDSFINDTDASCSQCGAANPHMTFPDNSIPRTIGELRAYAAENGVDPEEIRFFIGEDSREPGAFGIFEEGGVFTVYKNKADGKRSVRYQGEDEAYAVNMLLQKMHSAIIDRNARRAVAPHIAPHPKKTSRLFYVILLAVMLAIVVMIAFVRDTNHQRGYYIYGDNIYYYQGSWYGYGTDGWSPVTPDANFTDNADHYFDSDSYRSGSGCSSFEDSGYYDPDWNGK